MVKKKTKPTASSRRYGNPALPSERHTAALHLPSLSQRLPQRGPSREASALRRPQHRRLSRRRDGPALLLLPLTQCRRPARPPDLPAEESAPPLRPQGAGACRPRGSLTPAAPPRRPLGPGSPRIPGSRCGRYAAGPSFPSPPTNRTAGRPGAALRSATAGGTAPAAPAPPRSPHGRAPRPHHTKPPAALLLPPPLAPVPVPVPPPPLARRGAGSGRYLPEAAAGRGPDGAQCRRRRPLRCMAAPAPLPREEWKPARMRHRTPSAPARHRPAPLEGSPGLQRACAQGHTPPSCMYHRV